MQKPYNKFVIKNTVLKEHYCVYSKSEIDDVLSKTKRQAEITLIMLFGKAFKIIVIQLHYFFICISNL